MYLTWRTTKDELQVYLTEIAGYPEREYFRPNSFVHTPGMLPSACSAPSNGAFPNSRSLRVRQGYFPFWPSSSLWRLR